MPTLLSLTAVAAFWNAKMVQKTTLNQAWGALRVVLKDAFTFYEIKDLAGLAGIDVTRFSSLVQRAGGGASKGQLITALDSVIGRLDVSTKSKVLNCFAEEVVRQRPSHAGPLNEYLGRLGWQFEEERLIPIELFDVTELAELPEAARTDLVKAAARLRDGDLGGALAAACAAVDSATNAVYAERGLVSQPGDGFQSRCAKALKERRTYKKTANELISLGWEEAEATTLAQNLRGALNHGAFAMQSLRSKMSDVHGSKSVLEPLVFDSLKWAALIARMLK